MSLASKFAKFSGTGQVQAGRGWQGRSSSMVNKLNQGVQSLQNFPTYAKSFYSTPSTLQTGAGSTDAQTESVQQSALGTAPVQQATAGTSATTQNPQQAFSYTDLSPAQKSQYIEEILTAIGAPAAKIPSEEDFYAGKGVNKDVINTFDMSQVYTPQYDYNTMEPTPSPYAAMKANPEEYQKFQGAYKTYQTKANETAGDAWTRLMNNFSTENSPTTHGWNYNVYNRFGIPESTWNQFVVPYMQESAPVGTWPYQTKMTVNDIGMGYGQGYDQRFAMLAADRRSKAGGGLESVLSTAVPAAFLPGSFEIGKAADFARNKLGDQVWIEPLAGLINPVGHQVSEAVNYSKRDPGNILGVIERGLDQSGDINRSFGRVGSVLPEGIKSVVPVASRLIGGAINPVFGTTIGGLIGDQIVGGNNGEPTSDTGRNALKTLAASLAMQGVTSMMSSNPVTTGDINAGQMGSTQYTGGIPAGVNVDPGLAIGNAPAGALASVVPSWVKKGLGYASQLNKAKQMYETMKSSWDYDKPTFNMPSSATATASTASVADPVAVATGSTNILTGDTTTNAGTSALKSGSTSLVSAAQNLAGMFNKLGNMRQYQDQLRRFVR